MDPQTRMLICQARMSELQREAATERLAARKRGKMSRGFFSIPKATWTPMRRPAPKLGAASEGAH